MANESTTNINEASQNKKLESDALNREVKSAEAEINRLEAELARKKAELLSQQQEAHGDQRKEQEIKLDAIIKEEMPSTGGAVPADDSSPVPPIVDDLSGEEKLRLHQLKKMDKESQLKFLINISFQKGLDEGVKLLRALNNPHITDAFHDQLTDKFYKQLIEEKRIEEA